MGKWCSSGRAAQAPIVLQTAPSLSCCKSRASLLLLAPRRKLASALLHAHLVLIIKFGCAVHFSA